ncbi:baseplate assembly protein, partial [Klebsiella pneumoniae]|nr:baseplate assembly protein [Klebsiella pneumoniae]
YMAILKWEPRVRLTSITTARQFNGQMFVDVTGQITDTGESLSLTIPVS